MKFIDSHSHLHLHKSFPDFEEVIERAYAADVMNQVLVGCDMRDSLRASEFVQARDDFNWTLGVHPNDSQEVTDENLHIMHDILSKTGDFVDLVKGPVAIGEIGLDYHHDIHSKEVQAEAFRKQLALAIEFDLPVVVHVRDAFEDVMALIKESGVKKLVIHCFSAGVEQAEWAWGNGFLTSFTGSITYPKNTVLMEVVKSVPSHLYMLETDCPFLPPQTHRGKRNEPAYVRDIAEHVAELRGVSLERIADETTANAEKFFSI